MYPVKQLLHPYVLFQLHVAQFMQKEEHGKHMFPNKTIPDIQVSHYPLFEVLQVLQL